MQLEKITRVAGRAAHLPGEDVDTDRIIAARYMRSVTFDGLGEHAFEDARAEARARGGVHPFDDPRFAGATVLVVGRNFGCGSSREHAARALSKWGIRALVGESFADIFFGNATALGVPCVTVARPELDAIAAKIDAGAGTSLVEIDLTACLVRLEGAEIPCAIHEAARRALLHGAWDAIAELLARDAAIDQTARRLDYLRWRAP